MPRWPGIFGSPTAEASKASFFAHGVIGIVLGMLLVARVVLGSMRLSEAAANVTAFNKSLRTIAVLSNTVSDALTIFRRAPSSRRRRRPSSATSSSACSTSPSTATS